MNTTASTETLNMLATACRDVTTDELTSLQVLEVLASHTLSTSADELT
jgi:hypothetical protein